MKNGLIKKTLSISGTAGLLIGALGAWFILSQKRRKEEEQEAV